MRRDQRGDIPDPRVFVEPDDWLDDLQAVNRELHKVLEKWGPQALTLFDWGSVLGEEYGELCRAVNAYEFGSEGQGDLSGVYKEAVQVAAVAVHVAAVVRCYQPGVEA